MADGIPGLLRFAPNTAYFAGERVAAPNGDIVTAKVNFTSGASYSASNWNASTQDGRLGAVEILADTRGFPQRELVTGEDINNIREPGVYTCPSTTLAATLINWPAGSFTGALIVGKSKAGFYTSQEVVALVSQTAPPDHYSRVTRSSNNTTWTPWGFRGTPRGALANGTDLDTFRETGAWTHTNPSLLVNVPAGVSTGAITVENFVTPKTATALQRLTTLDGRVFTRTTTVTAGWAGVTWKPVGASGSSSVVVSDAGLSNAVLVQDFTRRRGGRKKTTTATLAFRFDHGLANFNALVRPEMESRNFKYSLALCSAQWDRPENAGVTASMVNTWVTAGLAEIWNHSKDHGSGDGSEAGWKAAILDGLTELRTQIPAAQIDGFAPPGSTGTNFGGFIDGTTLDQFYNTDGGRYILANHAVAAGYIGTTTRWQDGMVRQGLGHFTIDAYTLAQAQTAIQNAETDKRALQFMLHPSRLDTEGYITTATFITILDYVQAEVTAGRLKVVGPYDQLLQDVL